MLSSTSSFVFGEPGTNSSAAVADDQVTDVLLVPVTVAVNCCVALVIRVALGGLTVIATTVPSKRCLLMAYTFLVTHVCLARTLRSSCSATCASVR